MMLINIFLLFVLIKVLLCKTSIINSSTIDLIENSPLNTFVINLTRSLNIKRSSKLVLLNMIGFESNIFSIINESIYTKNLIDREEFLNEKYCFDRLYCKIEIHILVNDGFAYYVIPIHIVDENDNKPEFRKKEIELKFRENILNGYKIPFEGAKDLDEGKNGEINYFLDCSNNLNKNENIQLTINCLPLFQLIILSKSLFNNFDQLALKFNPSSFKYIQNQYQFILYAIDNNQFNKQLQNSIYLFIKIDKYQKDNQLKFSLSKYQFFVIIDKLSFNYIIGQVHAFSNNPSDIIYYKLLSNNQTHFININSLTGQLTFLNQNFLNINDQIEFLVQASSANMLVSYTKVNIFFRYFDYLVNISYKFEINSFKNQNKIYQLNNSNSFIIDQHIEINEELFKLSVFSYYYPIDKFILSLDNYFNTFSLIPSSSSINTYILKTRQCLISKNVYILNIGVKHKLSQQWLPNLDIELVVTDHWSTTATTTIENHINNETTEMSINLNMERLSTMAIESMNKSFEFCLENKIYILYEMEKKTNEIGLFKVLESNTTPNNNNNLSLLFNFINESEIMIDGCRMHIDKLNNSLNKSLEYELCCYSCSNENDDECYNIKIINEINPMSMISENEIEKTLLPIKPIEIVMFTLSIIFIIVTIILILLICRLKDIQICLTIKNYFSYGKKYGLNNNQHLSSSSLTKTKRVDSIVIHESHLPSFESIRIKNYTDQPYIFNIDHLLNQEPLPSTNMFTIPQLPSSSSLPSLRSSFNNEQDKSIFNIENRITTTRTSSSSSFLHETKQLLEMISSNQNLDLSKLASEV